MSLVIFHRKEIENKNREVGMDEIYKKINDIVTEIYYF